MTVGDVMERLYAFQTLRRTNRMTRRVVKMARACLSRIVPNERL